MITQNHTDSCKYCKYSVTINATRQTFCKYYGIKKLDDFCKKYTFDPFKYKIKRVRSLNSLKFKKEDFDIF